MTKMIFPLVMPAPVTGSPQYEANMRNFALEAYILTVLTERREILLALREAGARIPEVVGDNEYLSVVRSAAKQLAAPQTAFAKVAQTLIDAGALEPLAVFPDPQKAVLESVAKLATRGTAEQKPRPFDLEAAKRGEPLVTRDGRKARFVAYVPEARHEYRVLIFVEGLSTAKPVSENGRFTNMEHGLDVFMAPKPETYFNVSVGLAIKYKSEAEARQHCAPGSVVAKVVE